MAKNELVALYEDTRRRARAMGTRRLRFTTWRVRRALRRGRDTEALQVRLVAMDHELRARGVRTAPALPRRLRRDPRRSGRRRWWHR